MKYASLLRVSGAPVNGILETQLASACLREAASAKAGAFLISLKEMSFAAGYIYSFTKLWEGSGGRYGVPTP